MCFESVNHEKDKPESSFKPKEIVWKVLWKMKDQNEIKSFWCRAYKNSLASKENLFKRRCAQSSICPICDDEPESVEHMLFRCNWAKAVWFSFNIRALGDLGGNASVLKWTAEMVDKMSKNEAMDFRGKVAPIGWHIWKARYNYIFRKSRIDPMATIAAINHAWFEGSSILEIPNVHMDIPSTQEDPSTWRAPDGYCPKANCDVAIPKGGEEGKLAVVIRNWKGEVLDGLARPVFANSSLSGELGAIRTACHMLINSNIKGAMVEADNKLAITLSVSELVPPWEVSAEVPGHPPLRKRRRYPLQLGKKSW